MDCDGPMPDVTTQSGIVITSPNAPYLYPNDAQCKIIISYEEGQTVTINFLSFSVEEHGNTCYDWLEVLDGGSETSPQLGKRLCGESLPEKITSSGHSLTLVFRSNSDIRHSGFVIRVDSGKKLSRTQKKSHLFSILEIT